MIPTFISELVRTVVIMTVTGGLLCLLLLAIKPVIRHRLPKAAQYYFWLVVLGALLIPVSRIVVLPDTAPNVTPIHNVVERNVVSVAEETARFYREWGDELRFFTPATSDEPAQMTRYPREGAEPVMVTATPYPSLWVRGSTLFMRVYPWVAALVFIYSLIGYARFVRKLRRGYVCPGDLELNMLREISRGKRTPKLIKSTHAETPMLAGVFRPTIVLPIREYSNEQLHGILLHEITHMRRFDVAVKWLSLFACAVHWFNPLVWIARRQIDRACELACDETVVRNMDANNKQNYGDTLIAVAADKKIPLPVLSTTMCTEKKAIRERLAAIMKTKRYTRLAVLASVIAVLSVTGIVIVLGAGRNNETPNTGYDTFANELSFMELIRTSGQRVFVLENMTDRQRFETMTSVTLYADGTATVGNAPISSFFIPGAPHTIFEIEDDELAIFSNIFNTNEEWRDTTIARFAIIDNDTLEFLSTDVPLRAEVGARYVSTPDWRGIFGDGELDAAVLPESEEIIPDLNAHDVVAPIYISIDELTSGEEVAVARVFIRDGTSYEITVSSGTGSRIMVSLRDERTPGPGWRYSMSVSPENPRTTVIPFNGGLTGTYYLHIANYDNTVMTDISVRIVPSGVWANVELLDFTIGVLDVGNEIYPSNSTHANHHEIEFSAGLPEGFAAWDTSVASEPFVGMMDTGNFLIHGIGGHVIFNPRQRSFYFHGSNFAGLHGEAVMGGGYLTDNILSIDFAVGRNEIILPHIDGPLGTLAGPGVFFEYEIGSGVVTFNNYPFVFYNNSHPPIEFEMTEEGVVQFAHLLLFAYELVNNHRNIFP